MPLDIIIGAQWGDEGKGRMVDVLAANASIVARFNGGDNAGHTVTVGDDIFKLHLIPSGVIHAHTIGVMGNGMVINPVKLIEEMEQLRAAGVEINPDRLKISYAAHMITPAHHALDIAQEMVRGAERIGTTGRGIGPAYTDKVDRGGLRMEEILTPNDFVERLGDHLENTNRRLVEIYGADQLDVSGILQAYVEYGRILAPYITDVSALLTDALKRGERVVAEGAQGTLLDLDHGTYPYVTSSSPTAPGALLGLGLGLGYEGEIIGVTKSFQTRVGEGPFPTELAGEVADQLRGTGEQPWDEFGTTTRRPRRVGWLDTVLLRYAVRVNGFTAMALTKLDILTGIDPLRIAVAYRVADRTYENLPSGPKDLAPFEPVFDDLEGWEVDVSSIRTWSDLPGAAKQYIQSVEKYCGVKIRWVSVGPERNQIIKIE